MLDSLSYIHAADQDQPVLQDSLRQSILHFSQRQIGDTTGLSQKKADYFHAVIEKSANSSSGHRGISMPFALEQTDGVFGLILICFLFFAHIYNGGLSYLKENVTLVFSYAKSQRIHRQTTGKEILYNYFLIFQTIVLLSICLYDIFMEYSSVGQNVSRPFITILSFMVLISIFFTLKYNLYKFIGYVFDRSKLMIVWRNTYIVILEMLGILYFIPTLLLIYSNYYHQEIVIFMLILFLIVQIILFYRIIIFFIREKFSFLFLIAYLCSVEVLPYIFLFIGLIYLYRIDVFKILWL